METENRLKSREDTVWKKLKHYIKASPKRRKQRKNSLIKNSSSAPLPVIFVSDTGAHTNNMEYRNGRGTSSCNSSPLHYEMLPTKSKMSKSEQEISRLLQHQLELARSDHETNIRSASNLKVLRQLQQSAPRLDITQTRSSPCSPMHTRRNISPSPNSHKQRTHSPSPNLVYHSDGGSSGSEQSFQSGRSAPIPRRSVSPYCDYTDSSLNNSRLSPSYTPPSTPGKSRSSIQPETTDLLKHAHMNLIWAFIVDAAKEADLLKEFHTMDPKRWWRAMFLALKLKHGKAKASSLAGQLMGNPAVMTEIQGKLAGMAGASSDYTQSLPQSVRRRIKALKKLQFESTKIEAEFYAAVHALECQFSTKYAKVNEKRSEIIEGVVEPTDRDCDWPSDDEGGDIPPEPPEPTRGVDTFWLTALKNADLVSGMIQEHDESILAHLRDIRVQFSANPMGFTLEFHFSSNEYFDDSVLTKWYEMKSEPDVDDPFSFEGPEIVACKGCDIQWKPNKDITVVEVKKKQKNQKTGNVRVVTKTVQNDSFFNFFKPPELPDMTEDGNDVDETTEALLQADYEIGHFIRDRLVPHAVLWFTGEAIEDDDEEDEGADEDYEDAEYDDDYDPENDIKAAAQGKDCKQQ